MRSCGLTSRSVQDERIMSSVQISAARDAVVGCCLRWCTGVEALCVDGKRLFLGQLGSSGSTGRGYGCSDDWICTRGTSEGMLSLVHESNAVLTSSHSTDISKKKDCRSCDGHPAGLVSDSQAFKENIRTALFFIVQSLSETIAAEDFKLPK